LIAKLTIDWLVSGLIAPGLTTIAGRSDAGKSWLLLQLGLAVSAGGMFIGNLRCKKTDVLYLALEDNDYRIKNRLYKLGMQPTRDLYIDTANKVTPRNISAILDEMPTVEMVIIDTLGRYHEKEGIDSNNYAEVTKAAGALHTIAKERDIAVIACTHTKKGAKAEEGTEGVSGSKALVSVSDTVLMLTRKVEETEGKLYVTGRDVRERTIEMEHTESWLWYDKNVNAEVEPYMECEGFGGL
jgi:RecA-family ATPase